MPLRCRRDAWKPFSEILDFEVISCDYSDELYNLECVGNKDVLALLKNYHQRLMLQYT